MNPNKTTAGIAAIVILLAAAIAIYEVRETRDAQAALATANGQQEELRAKFRDLEDRLRAEGKRLQAVEEDNAKLLKAIETSSERVAAVAAANAPITHDVVEARYKHAQELARSGDSEAALKDFLWCFDEGMPRVSSYGGVRLSFLLSEIEKLGPAGAAALRDRRDRAQKRLLASANDYDATSEFAALNRTLKENENTLAIFDQLPPDDRRRQTLASSAFDQLVAAQRYPDALLGRPYAQISSRFEMESSERPLPANIANPEMIRKAQRNYLITSTTNNIEVLAGAGDLDHAQALAARLLAYDSSDETKAVVQQHLTRAGHPELLSNPPKP